MNLLVTLFGYMVAVLAGACILAMLVAALSFLVIFISELWS